MSLGEGASDDLHSAASVLVMFGSKGWKTKAASWVHLVSTTLTRPEGHTHAGRSTPAQRGTHTQAGPPLDSVLCAFMWFDGSARARGTSSDSVDEDDALDER